MKFKKHNVFFNKTMPVLVWFIYRPHCELFFCCCLNYFLLLKHGRYAIEVAVLRCEIILEATLRIISNNVTCFFFPLINKKWN